MPIRIEPTREYPVPYDDADYVNECFEEELAMYGETAHMQKVMGAEVTINELDPTEERRFLQSALKNKKTDALLRQNTALAAYEFLQEYGKLVAFDAAEVRRAVTTKLLALADCGNPKYELRALELLGKHRDIGLFTERSEVKITYENATDLENTIKERIKRILGAEVVDVRPTRAHLDETLGKIDMHEIEEAVYEESKTFKNIIKPREEP